MIRHATPEDFRRCLVMAERFWRQTLYSPAVPFDPIGALNMFAAARSARLFLVVEPDGPAPVTRPEGFILGLISGLLGNVNVTHVSELAYWIEPDYRHRWGGALLDAFEDAARAAGARYLNMAALQASMPERVEQIYLDRGFSKSETLYTKEL